MTLLPSPLAHSTLGEKCAVYLDHVTDHFPPFLHSLRPRLDPLLTYLPTPFRSLAQALPFDADEQTTALCVAVLVCVLSLIVMSWRNLWRRSPNYSSAPRVRDDDFSYIRPDDIVDPPLIGHHGGTADAEPDILCLRNRGTIYPLHFPAYAIDDGELTVGGLRQEAAAKMGAEQLNCVRLLYKGKLLKDDTRTCKTEGLKQHSEVLCVVSEVGASTPSDDSDYENERNDSHEGLQPPSREGPSRLAPPRPTSSGRSGTPSPAPSLKNLRAPLEQVNVLTAYLQQELIPLCDEYVTDPPTEPKKRDFEYKKLSEIILAQVMLKADGIEPDGNEAVRNARRALIKEAQATLNRLDKVEKL
ncbi:hypothetical protein NUU61_009081 [Penicillium alfredii]|uniref:BAG domain-containing protein n=1 Tax=Penicillium alfredii TaxID=1506179 RepID=A0A9W9EMG0_9EURO|nr:uncharacterized protein NUU61_009081 [Penicillium alfredii]KAJ5084502.1 hypothetical protein NUU61_009081 [Penicillium alfredii]